jgi:hypothetical protein
MTRVLSLALTIFVLSSTPAAADPPPDLAANAALKHWQAFATVPEFTAAEKDKLTAECLTMPLDAQARRSVTRAKYALDMMHRGAKLPRCDWAIGWADEGLFNRLPYLESARVLSSLACLRARLRFEEGQSALATEDILAAMTLARHVSLDGSLPSILTRYAIERRMGETLARYLLRLDVGTLKDLNKDLGALPAGGSLATGVREEQILETGWYVRKVKEAEDHEAGLAVLSQLWGSREEGRVLLEECGGVPAGVVKYTEELRSWYPQLAKQMELPLDQFEKEQERAAIKFAANPMYKRFVPGILRCRWHKAQADVRRALLSAAVAVQLDGRDALKHHPDPAVGGPFDYVAFKGGFEVRSKWKLDKKLRSKWVLDPPETLVLTVGWRGK